MNALRRHPAMIGIAAVVLVFTLLPLGVVVAIGFSSSPFLVFPPPGVSLQWFGRFLGDPSFVDALWVSLRIAAIVTGFGVTLGLLCAFGLWKLPPGAIRRVLLGVILTPLIFPVIVLAMALLLFLSELDLLGSRTGLIAAHLLIVVPLAVATIGAALENLNPQVDEAAASLGAGPWARFRLITVPQIWTAVIGSAILSFLFSFNDVTFAAFIGGPDTQTLPLKLFSYIRYQVNPLIGAVSAVFILATLTVILAFDWLVGFNRLVGLKE